MLCVDAAGCASWEHSKASLGSLRTWRVIIRSFDDAWMNTGLFFKTCVGFEGNRVEEIEVGITGLLDGIRREEIEKLISCVGLLEGTRVEEIEVWLGGVGLFGGIRGEEIEKLISCVGLHEGIRVEEIETWLGRTGLLGGSFGVGLGFCLSASFGSSRTPSLTTVPLTSQGRLRAAEVLG